MRALTRIRTLAAALMLLLFIATTALAGVPGRPKERPEGPGEPNPAEVGEPDGGHASIQMFLRQLLAAAQLSNPNFRRFALPLRRVGTRASADLRTRIARGDPR